MYAGGSYIDLFNSDPQSELFSGLVPNSVVASDNQNVLTGVGLPAGSVLMGRGSMMPTAGTLSGTANQISVTSTPAGFKFELPQDIHIEASPTFMSMILTGQLELDPFEIKVDPTFGLSFFDNSTSEIAVPLSILPADGLLGSAVAIGTKLIVNNDIEFLYGATKQTIGAAMPTSDSKWTLPDTGLANLTFPALETENKWTNRQMYDDDTDATSTTSGSATFAGGVGIAKSLHAANIATGALTATSVATSSLTVGGQSITPVDTSNLVTTNTSQSITGEKKFGSKTTMNTARVTGEAHVDALRASWYILCNSDWNQIAFLDPDSGRSQLVLSFPTALAGGPWHYTTPEDLRTNCEFIMSAGNQTIGGNKSFTGTVTVGGQSVTPSNYVTLNTPQTITGTKTFGQINASGIAIDGFGLQPANYVLNHSNQTIGGQKTFTQRIVGTSDIMIGSVNHGILRLSSYGGGDARIEGGYVTDAEYFLRFYCRGELVAEMNHGYPGSGRTREFHLYGGLYFRNGGNTRMSYYGVVNLNTSFVAEGTATINTNPAVTIRCARVGHMVTLDIAPSQTNFHVTNGNPALITQAQLPADYRPSSTKQGSCIVNNQSNRFTPALVSVNSLGIVKIEPGPNGYFTGSLGSNNNLYSFSISYNL